MKDYRMRRAYWAMGLALALSTAAFGCGDPSETSIRHPQDTERMLPADLKHAAIGPEAPELRGPILTAIHSAGVIGNVGKENGLPEDVLTSVLDAAFIPNGDIAIVDREAKSPRRFSPAGVFQAILGSPSDLHQPVSIAAGDDHLLVSGLDRRVVKYTFVDGSPTLTRSVKLPMTAVDVCAVDDDILVHAADPKTGLILHRFGWDGQKKAAFGHIYSRRNELVFFQVAQGHIACFQSEHTVVFAPTGVLPEVRAYDTRTGAEKWVLILDGYVPTGLFEQERSTSVRIPDTGYHSISQVLPVAPDRVLVQINFVASYEDARARRVSSRRSIVVNARSGEVVESSMAIPEIVSISATSPSRYAAKRPDSGMGLAIMSRSAGGVTP